MQDGDVSDFSSDDQFNGTAFTNSEDAKDDLFTFGCKSSGAPAATSFSIVQDGMTRDVSSCKVTRSSEADGGGTPSAKTVEVADPVVSIAHFGTGWAEDDPERLTVCWMG